MTIHYQKNLKEFARQLRNNSTKAEIKLWQHLKGKQLMGYDFHRQKPIDCFIADFYCYRLKLAIEVDGLTHDWEKIIQKDKIKAEQLKDLGLNILRFTDVEVMKNIDSVIQAIKNYIAEFENTPPTPLDRGELNVKP